MQMCRLRVLSLIAVLLLLAACGGGGGDGGGAGGVTTPVVYSGSVNPAAISVTNAAALTAGVMGAGDAASVILGASMSGDDAAQERRSGVVDLSRRLGRGLREATVRVEKAAASRRTAQAVIPVDQTEPCDSGSVRTSGTLNDNGTGTLTLAFNDCRLGTDTLSGTATVRVDAFDMPMRQPTDFTVSFVRLAFRGPGLNVDAGGTLHSQLNLATNTEILTEDIVSVNNSTGRGSRTENLRFVNVYDSIFFPTSATVQVSGRTYDHVHGYLDITTLAPLAFASASQFFPNAGQLVLAGAGGRGIRVTAFSAALARLELDLTGGGYVAGEFAMLKWTELAGPPGSDLGDNDGDGIHNSWETANGLNPADAGDAGLDQDGDGTSTMREYYVASNPNSAGTVPPIDPTVTAATFFAPAVDYAARTNPTAIAIGDFNGDGKVDAAVANWNDNGVSVLLGDGTGGFGAATGFAAGATPKAVAVGDFNGDGKQDLAVANFGGVSVSVLLGNGSGAFGAPADFALTNQMNPSAVAVGDFNGDGRQDLAVAMGFGFSSAAAGHVTVLLGDGAGGFAAPANFMVGGGPASVATGDFNGDGRLDFAVANPGAGTVSILLGNGAGAFGAATDLAVADRPGAVAVGDFNGDGRPDLAVAVGMSTINNAHVAILAGTGTGTFGPATIFVLDRVNGAYPTGIATSDFNGDGKLDVAVADERGAGRVYVLLGDGAGSFGMSNYFLALANQPAAVAAADVDSDGRPDLVAATRSGSNAALASASLNTLP